MTSSYDSFRTKVDSLIGRSNANYLEQSLQSAAVITGTFYVSTISFQRLAGILSIHSGRSLVPSVFGFVSVTASSFLSFKVNDSIPAICDSPQKYFADLPSAPSQQWVADERSAFSVLVFSILEGKKNMTLVPSSVISVGVHAQHGNFLRMFQGSVISTDPTATPKERWTIQKLGKRYGCHHCGSKQYLRGNVNFIADHMPPTKVALQKNNAWWRKLLNIKTVQKLYPQCQKCFSLQGNAVRLNQHVLIHHYKLKVHHFSPLIVYFLMQNSQFLEFLDFCAPENIVEIIKSFK